MAIFYFIAAYVILDRYDRKLKHYKKDQPTYIDNRQIHIYNDTKKPVDNLR